MRPQPRSPGPISIKAGQRPRDDFGGYTAPARVDGDHAPAVERQQGHAIGGHDQQGDAGLLRDQGIRRYRRTTRPYPAYGGRVHLTGDGSEPGPLQQWPGAGQPGIRCMANEAHGYGRIGFRPLVSAGRALEVDLVYDRHGSSQA